MKSLCGYTEQQFIRLSSLLVSVYLWGLLALRKIQDLTRHQKRKSITAGRALGAGVICQPGSWQFSPLMNVQHPPLTTSLEESGNRPTLNT